MSVTGPAAPVVCLDGPSGAGKGTVSMMVASALDFHRLDSGALYRLVGLAAVERSMDLDDAPALGVLAGELDIAFHGSGCDDEQVWMNGRRVDELIRNEEVAAAASQVARHTPVRDALLKVQRDFQQPPGLVADGRDMGTVVFPQAEVKIFLTASADERAERRLKQLKEKGVNATFRALLGEIQARDERDRTRAVAPLRPARDATVVDTTGIAVEAVCRQILSIVEERL